jgi:DNA-binding transcriptional ArsR family regulator
MRNDAYMQMAHFFVEQNCGFMQIDLSMPKTDCTDILKALADRSRMRIVKSLLDQSSGVNDLAEALTLSQYNVSKHLRVLKQAGIVEVHPDGTRREYAIVKSFRERLKKENHVLDFGCCSFRFDQLPD